MFLRDATNKLLAERKFKEFIRPVDSEEVSLFTVHTVYMRDENIHVHIHTVHVHVYTCHYNECFVVCMALLASFFLLHLSLTRKLTVHVCTSVAVLFVFGGH